MFDFMLPKVPQVEVKDLYNAIKANENISILDVRTEGEYSKEKIQNSINLPVDQLAGKIETTSPDKNKKIYVYCLSGSRSVFAVDTMVKLGYKNVFDIKSGLLAWRVNQFPVSK